MYKKTVKRKHRKVKKLFNFINIVKKNNKILYYKTMEVKNHKKSKAYKASLNKEIFQLIY